MSASLAYGGVRHCLACARDEADPLDRIDWFQKALLWRAWARELRRAK